MLAQADQDNTAELSSPAKTCLYALGQHCTLSQTYLNNNDQIILLCNVSPPQSIQRYIGYFPYKSCLLAMSKIEKVKTLCNVVKEAPDNVAQKKILINVEPKKSNLVSGNHPCKNVSVIHPPTQSRLYQNIYL